MLVLLVIMYNSNEWYHLIKFLAPLPVLEKLSQNISFHTDYLDLMSASIVIPDEINISSNLNEQF
jgi:hypothetical protein